MSKRRQYTDEERATACALLEANGYPDKKGALEQTANTVDIPARTISRWFNGENNPPPDKVVSEKRIELKELLQQELGLTLKAMSAKRGDALYSSLSWTMAVLVDKLILLNGGATERLAIEDWRTEAIRMIQAKEVDFKSVVEQFGKHDAELLFKQSGVPIEA